MTMSWKVCFSSETVRKSPSGFSCFCAIFAREAGPKEFQTLCDWDNWVDFQLGCFRVMCLLIVISNSGGVQQEIDRDKSW